MSKLNPFEHRGKYPIYDSNNHPRISYEFIKAGGTVRKLAAALGIHHDTIYEWIKKYPEYADAVQRGKDDFNGASVEVALLKRAKGFRYKEHTMESPQIVIRPGVNEDIVREILKNPPKPVLTKTVTKLVPPETQAIQFFLKNRLPIRWPKNGDEPGAQKFYFLTHEDIQKMLSGETEDGIPDRLPPIPESTPKPKKGGKS